MTEIRANPAPSAIMIRMESQPCMRRIGRLVNDFPSRRHMLAHRCTVAIRRQPLSTVRLKPDTTGIPLIITVRVPVVPEPRSRHTSCFDMPRPRRSYVTPGVSVFRDHADRPSRVVFRYVEPTPSAWCFGSVRLQPDRDPERSHSYPGVVVRRVSSTGIPIVK